MWRILVTVMLMTAAIASADPWTVVTSDFRQGTGTLQRVSGDGIVLRQRDAVHELPWSNVLLLRQQNVSAPAEPEPFVLHLRNGQRLSGRPAAMDAESITWRSGLGEMKLPLEALRGWARTGVDLPATATDDLLVLSNGDELRGIVDGAPNGLAVDHGAGVANVAWDSIRSITLAEVGEAPAAAGGLLVRLSNGSTMLARQITGKGDQLTITDGGNQQLNVALEGVAHIENRAGQTTFLAWQNPQSARYTPYLAIGDTSEPAITIEEELTIGSRVFANVLKVRPQTTLEYQAPADGEFHLEYAAAHPGPLTDMTLTITAGDKPVAERKNVNSAAVAEPVRVPVTKGQSVRIDVGYGANFDADDEMLLLNAAFIGR